MSKKTEEVFLSGRIDPAKLVILDEEIAVMVFKNRYKKEEKHPDYSVVQVQGEKLVNIGALWVHHREVTNDESE